MNQLHVRCNATQAVKEDFVRLQCWLKRNHPNWEAHCGLVKELDSESGKIKWVIPQQTKQPGERAV